jgi:tryptophanyl-tRNA synthetase
MLADLQPLHDKRAYYAAHADEALQIFIEGSQRARRVAQETMEQAREAMHIPHPEAKGQAAKDQP